MYYPITFGNQGYTCSFCGRWVKNGTYHSCNAWQPATPITTFYPSYNFYFSFNMPYFIPCTVHSKKVKMPEIKEINGK